MQAILDGSVDPRIMRRIGFPWSEQLVRRTLASVGGTLAAARDALRDGLRRKSGRRHPPRVSRRRRGLLRVQRPGGRDPRAARDGLAARAAVIDLDVHQGDGTAAIFENDPEVLTVSIHGENNFPFRKQRSRIDVALPDGTGDDEYLQHVERLLPEVLAFDPAVIFYQAGVDGLAGDRLGRLALSPEGLQSATGGC